MPDELPPLDKFVVSSFSAGDLSWPVVVMAKDPRVNGYVVPAVDSACPDPRYPNHDFIGVTPTNIDNRVLWTWELLPGPWIYDTRDDLLLGPVQRQRRAVRVSTPPQVTNPTATVKTTYEARDGSSIVAWEIVETSSDGTGSAGNPAFPILTDDFYDKIRGPVQQVSQVTIKTGTEVGSLAESGGTVTEIRYEVIDEFKLKKITETYALASVPTITTEHIDTVMKNKITEARTLVLASSITTQAVISGSDIVVTSKEEGKAALLATKLVTTIAAPAASDAGSALVETKTMSYQYPSRIDIDLLDALGTAIGYQQPMGRLVEATVKTYWVVSASKPTLTFDTIIPHTIWINGVKYTDVLHDATVRDYSGTPVSFDATTPSNTTYAGSWIGTEKLIDGEVKAARYQLLWKVEAVYLTMR